MPGTVVAPVSTTAPVFLCLVAFMPPGSERASQYYHPQALNQKFSESFGMKYAPAIVKKVKQYFLREKVARKEQTASDIKFKKKFYKNEIKIFLKHMIR
jgi:hypothetical protein